MRRGGKPVYSFQDLVSVKAAKELVDRGFKAAEIRKAIEGVRASLPHVDRPLDRIRVAFDGTRAGGRRRGERLRVDRPEGVRLRPRPSWRGDRSGAERRRRDGGPSRRRRPPDAAAPTATRAPARSAYDWFVEGTRAEACGGDEGDARAESCYRRRWRSTRGWPPRTPTWAASPTARGDAAAAREAFEAALALDPDQPEARFNLANLILEAGDLELAVAEFRRVLQSAPDFADAHYNLAVALERLGGRAQARAHLEHYLALEPTTSSWAEQARALIARLA